MSFFRWWPVGGDDCSVTRSSRSTYGFLSVMRNLSHRSFVTGEEAENELWINIKKCPASCEYLINHCCCQNVVNIFTDLLWIWSEVALSPNCLTAPYDQSKPRPFPNVDQSHSVSPTYHRLYSITLSLPPMNARVFSLWILGYIVCFATVKSRETPRTFWRSQMCFHFFLSLAFYAKTLT